MNQNAVSYDDADVLQNSEMSHPTDGSVSEDEASGWISSINADVRHMATCFKDFPVLGGVTSLFQRTLMSVTSGIEQLERDCELDPHVWRADKDRTSESLTLPWEIQQKIEDSDILVYVTDEELMDEILALSRHEETFLRPFSRGDSRELDDEQGFFLDEPRISLIRRLLDVDENLAAIHARSSGRTNTEEATFLKNIIGRRNTEETIFWKNYFFHCNITRQKFLDSHASGHGKIHVSRTPSEASFELKQIADQNVPDDDSSLVPASVSDDDLSYRIIPSPKSTDTLNTTRSEDDLVIVGRETECAYDES